MQTSMMIRNLHLAAAICDTLAMQDFRYIDDVETWLGPMTYEAFWREIKPFCLVLEYRSVCDAKIETGQVPREDILFGLKAMACRELSRRHKLARRPSTPWLKVVK